jgi:hypothetical protein
LIIKDKDKSQMFLVAIFFLMPILAYFMARIVWDYYRFGLIINGVGMFFLAASGVQIVFLTYLGYWIFKVLKSK